MNHEHLTKRRNEVYARHAILESVPGSGWHRDDAQARSERDAGYQPISSRPIAIQDDDRIYFVGACVGVVRTALEKFVEKYAADRKAEIEVAQAADTEPSEVSVLLRSADRVARRVSASDGEVIELSSRDFNCVLYALDSLNVLVVSTGAIA